MLKRLIKAHTEFVHQHPQFPLLNRLQDDITQLQSQQIKSLPKDQQSVFCISLLWLTEASLIKQNLGDSTLGLHIDNILKTATGRFSESQLLALKTEHKEWATMESLNENCPTSVIR